ncbi:SDR family NAD(P)-dependent oxidoreductase [Algoriphagus boritolerans]|uniref:NAD(P)-dependent dehydrogenase, short-chain alcohol dehydrogenase family n=1 Tax=Algoriphagus boritolerans DSM 17298 = JCM 18970 TaxID=1120964 RepID=A0A1H5THQ6_9BACT|nr:SDR family NAD(P)-dependent oxidoreductase [Algoriphagus boritolerans]SEF62290.1 NAD(P)-dependent dehydrogenase, short-chain alcohol dehydrogenase family [Algoriphagus boritolerans DSM 17298 = JCM 18970]
MNLVLTGSTSGIGWETLKELLPEFKKVILPVRNRDKAKKMIEGLPDKNKIHLVSVDLSEMKSVVTGANEILGLADQIDVLINNAGGMYPAKKLTSEGLDLTFATNHLGHFLLTKCLMPALKKGKAKIINVSSEAHRISGDPSADLSLKKSANTVAAYSKVKLYNILFTNELKNRFESYGISAYSLHPGAVRTAFGAETSGIAKGIIRLTQLFFISPKSGAQTTIFLAKTPASKLRNGSYYVRKKPKSPTSTALNKELAAKLWEYSETVLSELKV